MPTKFRIGDRVEDRESDKPGRVVHVYREIDLRDDVVVVLFDDSVDALAVPIDSIRKVVRGQSRATPKSRARRRPMVARTSSS
jgi:hypothetical protein